jgi:hypothetical protein
MEGILFQANTLNFIREIESDRCGAEILVFLLKEPESDYDGGQIAAAISLPLLDVLSSIGFLLNRGLLHASLRNHVPYYSLTAEPASPRKDRSPVLFR